MVVCNTLWYRDAAYFAVPWRGKWETEVGGVSTGHSIHITDLMLWLLGDWPWAELRAQVATIDRAIENENLAAGLVRFGNGALGTIASGTLSPRQVTYLRIDFQGGTLEVEGLYGYSNENWRFTPLDPNADFSAWLPVPENHPADHAAQYAQLLDSMDAGTRPPVSGEEGRRILEFTTSLYKAAFTGQAVARGSITPDDPYYRSLSGKAPAD
jgi:predicted dehydrogenase